MHPTGASHAHHSIAQRFESFWRVDIHNERGDLALSSGSIHPHLRNAQHFDWFRKPDIHNEHDSPADRFLRIETPRQSVRNDRLQADWRDAANLGHRPSPFGFTAFRVISQAGYPQRPTQHDRPLALDLARPLREIAGRAAPIARTLLPSDRVEEPASPGGCAWPRTIPHTAFSIASEIDCPHPGGNAERLTALLFVPPASASHRLQIELPDSMTSPKFAIGPRTAFSYRFTAGYPQPASRHHRPPPHQTAPAPDRGGHEHSVFTPFAPAYPHRKA